MNLKKLGMTAYEEGIYLALLRKGRSGAKEISDASRVPPTAVYPNLKSLEKKGLIQKIEGETSLYEALEPKNALLSLADRQKNELDLETESAIKQISLIKKDEAILQDPVQMSIGKELSARLFADFSDRTKKSILIMGWKFRETKSAIHIIKTLRNLKLKGKDVRLITNDEKYENNKILIEIKKTGVPIRFHPLGNFSIVVRDSEETKITLKKPELGQRVNLHIEDRDLSRAMHDYVLTIWSKSKII